MVARKEAVTVVAPIPGAARAGATTGAVTARAEALIRAGVTAARAAVMVMVMVMETGTEMAVVPARAQAQVPVPVMVMAMAPDSRGAMGTRCISRKARPWRSSTTNLPSG